MWQTPKAVVAEILRAIVGQHISGHDKDYSARDIFGDVALRVCGLALCSGNITHNGYFAMPLNSPTLTEFLQMAWAGLKHATGTPPLRGLVSLATLSADGPQVRQVVVRDLDPLQGRLRFYTDNATTKIREIHANPNVSILHWNDATQFQTRLSGAAQILDADQTSTLWRKLPDSNRQNYGVEPAPGQPINGHDAFTRMPNVDRFCVVEITVQRIDIVHLSTPAHKRAVFARSDDWAGQWVAP